MNLIKKKETTDKIHLKANIFYIILGKSVQISTLSFHTGNVHDR